MRSEKAIQTQLDKCKVADESVSALEWVLEDKTKRYSIEELQKIANSISEDTHIIDNFLRFIKEELK